MPTTPWQVDLAHSSLSFTVRHMMVSKVRGHFRRFRAQLDLDLDAALLAASRVEASVEVASIDTGAPDRDTHLRSADFFDVETFPELTFRSTRVTPHGKERFTLTGELSMHGVTREVTLEGQVGGRGKDPWGNERAGFSATTHLNRKDFGLQWNQALETGGVLVSERVDVELDIQAFRPASR